MDICMDYNEGIIALPVYSSGTLYAGQGMKWGAEGSAEGKKALITVDGQADNQFAILIDGGTSCATNVQTPTIIQKRVRLLNNPSLLKIYYDMNQDNDADVSSSTSTVVTVAACDDYLDGSWLYINSGTGAGQLRYIKAANTTTMTVNTAFTTTPDNTSDIILIRYVGLQEVSAGLSLDTTYYGKIATVLNETDTSFIIPLKNFVQGPFGIKELDITANPDLETDGLNSRGVRFFSICVNSDGLYATGI
jgi:hypothetical protein